MSIFDYMPILRCYAWRFWRLSSLFRCWLRLFICRYALFFMPAVCCHAVIIIFRCHADTITRYYWSFALIVWCAMLLMARITHTHWYYAMPLDARKMRKDMICVRRDKRGARARYADYWCHWLLRFCHHARSVAMRFFAAVIDACLSLFMILLMLLFIISLSFFFAATPLDYFCCRAHAADDADYAIYFSRLRYVAAADAMIAVMPCRRFHTCRCLMPFVYAWCLFFFYAFELLRYAFLRFIFDDATPPLIDAATFMMFAADALMLITPAYCWCWFFAPMMFWCLLTLLRDVYGCLLRWCPIISFSSSPADYLAADARRERWGSAQSSSRKMSAQMCAQRSEKMLCAARWARRQRKRLRLMPRLFWLFYWCWYAVACFSFRYFSSLLMPMMMMRVYADYLFRYAAHAVDADVDILILFYFHAWCRFAIYDYYFHAFSLFSLMPMPLRAWLFFHYFHSIILLLMLIIFAAATRLFDAMRAARMIIIMFAFAYVVYDAVIRFAWYFHWRLLFIIYLPDADMMILFFAIDVISYWWLPLISCRWYYYLLFLPDYSFRLRLFHYFSDDADALIFYWYFFFDDMPPAVVRHLRLMS